MTILPGHLHPSETPTAWLRGSLGEMGWEELGKWKYHSHLESGSVSGQDGGSGQNQETGKGASRAARILSWAEEEAVSGGLVIPLPRGAHIHQPGQAAGAGHRYQARRCPISLGPVGWTCFLCPCVRPDHLFLLFYTSDGQQNYFCQNLCYDSRGRVVFRDAFEILLNNL